MRGGVLVVDDSPESRALTAEMLAAEGIDATMATTGAAALAVFPVARPACVLLDIGLPDMDGIAVCERLRALPGGDQVAIVFVTARRDVDTFDRALRAGGDDFLTKPFRPAELVIRIETARRLRKLAAERGALSRELKRQRDELQRLQLQREQLAEFLVHDLKNPVHSISLLASRAMGLVQGEPRALDATGKIREEARGLLRMITNLLDINRSQEGRLVAARRAVVLGELIAAAIGDLQARAAAANVTVVTDVQISTAYVDAELVHRVLTNLIDNAIRHAPEHSQIRVSVQHVADRMQLRVADDGRGVPPELREAIFERFTSTGERGNHGLGLAFCRVAAAAHGGRIFVDDSQPGAVFCVEVPDAR